MDTSRASSATSPGVWIVDDTGFIKKGVRSAGGARQYTGTSGKIDNCQLGMFLAHGSARGRALVDRELYLPTSWTEDADRCAAPRSQPRPGSRRSPSSVSTFWPARTLSACRWGG